MCLASTTTHPRSWVHGEFWNEVTSYLAQELTLQGCLESPPTAEYQWFNAANAWGEEVPLPKVWAREFSWVGALSLLSRLGGLMTFMALFFSLVGLWAGSVHPGWPFILPHYPVFSIFLSPSSHSRHLSVEDLRKMYPILSPWHFIPSDRKKAESSFVGSGSWWHLCLILSFSTYQRAIILFNTICLVYVNSQEIYKLLIYRSLLIYLSSVVYNSIFYYMLP